ncbi:hypothetical protein VN97_g12876, partial [Penicillium thymicola]
DLPNLSGCPSSSAGSGIGQFPGFRGRVGLLAFHSCMSPGPDRGRWCKVFRYVDPCASSRDCGGKGLGSPRGWVRQAHNHNRIITTNFPPRYSDFSVQVMGYYPDDTVVFEISYTSRTLR